MANQVQQKPSEEEKKEWVDNAHFSVFIDLAELKVKRNRENLEEESCAELTSYANL